MPFRKVFKHRGYYLFSSEAYGGGTPSVYNWFRIPNDPDEFRGWLTLQRAVCDHRIQAGYIKDINGLIHVNEEPGIVTKERPMSDGNLDLDQDWLELDLDKLLLSFNGLPLFRLDRLPLTWSKFIGYDSYGHYAFTLHTPEETRYLKSSPPLVKEHMTDTYLRLINGIAPTGIHNLLGLNQNPSLREQVRIALLEVCIGYIMRTHKAGCHLRALEMCSDRDDIPDVLLTMASSLISYAISPAIHPKPGLIIETNSKLSRDFTWLRRDMCLLMSTHLNDEMNLQAAIVQLVSHILDKAAVGSIVYGIAFSIHHCSIVRIVKHTGNDSSLMHTPALQFLPSFYATSPSTPGILALARLGYLQDPDLTVFSKARQIVQQTWVQENRGQEGFAGRFLALKQVLQTIPQPTRLTQRLPPEILFNIADFIQDMRDLANYSLVSQETMYAGASIMRSPHIVDYRLIGFVPQDRDVVMADENSKSEMDCNNLCHGLFHAINNQGHVVLLRIGCKNSENKKDTDHNGVFELPFVQGARNDGNIEVPYCVVNE